MLSLVTPQHPSLVSPSQVEVEVVLQLIRPSAELSCVRILLSYTLPSTGVQQKGYFLVHLQSGDVNFRVRSRLRGKLDLA